jgi:hypothetical protein
VREFYLKKLRNDERYHISFEYSGGTFIEHHRIYNTNKSKLLWEKKINLSKTLLRR